MAEVKWKRIVALIFCIGVSYLILSGSRIHSNGDKPEIDFGSIYFGAQYVIRHEDPYDPETQLSQFGAEGERLMEKGHSVTAMQVNLPTTLLVISPLARLPWPVAQKLWSVTMATVLLVAAYLIWDIAGSYSAIAGWILCFMLLNCEVLFLLGNIAGFSVCICVISTWCFLKERFAIAGVLLLAVSLALKPHDAGLVWLYFLLVGGHQRMRALQALAITGILASLAVIWITPVSPHWVHELHKNLEIASLSGGTSDPSPAGITTRTFGSIIDLQNSIAIFRSTPQFYNTASYLIAGFPILVWILALVRRRLTPKAALLALAAISVLTMLPVYHRPYDAKLLMLTVPACAMLWSEKGRFRRTALILSCAAIFVTSDLPLLIWEAVTRAIPVSPATWTGKFILLILQPAPVVLLATGCFYLWVYLRHGTPIRGTQNEDAISLTAAGS